MTDTPVPFLDLGRSHAALAPALVERFAELIQSGVFVNGPAVSQFEDELANAVSARFCVGTSSGLDALRLGLLSAGLERGDEVIAPAMTFVATLEAVTQAGGVPVIVDISDLDHNLDPDAASSALNERTRYILPVHLYGQLADMRRLSELELPILEDACQALGAMRDGIRAGESGVATAFSFYPGKNLGAIGDAGALVTNDPELADTARALREHGQRRKYEHDLEGYTARLDTVQAVVLLEKLPLLEQWNEARATVAARYCDELAGIGDLVLPPVPEGSDPVWHLFVIRTADPDALGASLAAHGIRTGRHYPTPVHMTKAYAHLGYAQGTFPVAEKLADECLSLPIFPELHESEVERVIAAISEHFGHG